jgi:hypothetical protein
MATVALDLAPSAREPGVPARLENEADSGEGRLGEEEKAPPGDLPNPAPAIPPPEGGPNGSRIGDEECRWGLPLCSDEYTP